MNSRLSDAIVFMRVANAVNYMSDILQPVSLDMLRNWIKSTNEIPMENKHQEAMRLFHVEVIEAYIKAREYAQAHAQQNSRNN